MSINEIRAEIRTEAMEMLTKGQITLGEFHQILDRTAKM